MIYFAILLVTSPIWVMLYFAIYKLYLIFSKKDNVLTDLSIKTLKEDAYNVKSKSDFSSASIESEIIAVISAAVSLYKK